MKKPTFEQFAEFIRAFAQLPSSKEVIRSTRFEKDLGITGDDGVALLEAVEQKYRINLSSEEHGVRKIFNLKINEYLFHPEGVNLHGNNYIVREFTVGELYDAVSNAGIDERSV